MKRMSGFTLLELLVSMALGSIILLTAATMLGEAGDSYGHVTRGIHAEREARAALSRISADVRAALDQQGALRLDSGGKIGFLTTLPGSAQNKTLRIGDLCAVVYQLKDLESDNRIVRCLTRTVHESSETYRAIKEGNVGEILSRADEDAEPLAIGVMKCSFMPKTRRSDGTWEEWKESSEHMPDSIEIKITVANREESKRWTQARDWDEPSELENGKATTRSMMIRYGHE